MPEPGIPMTALRPSLADGWPHGALWRREASAGDALVLEQPANSPVRFRLNVGEKRARMRARVALPVSHRRAALARVRIRSRSEPGEAARTIWSATLLRVGRFGRPASRRLDVELPARAELELTLSAQAPAGERLVWFQPEIDLTR